MEPLDRIAETANRVSGLAAERDRGDLAERLDEQLARSSTAALVVIGGVSKGKSSLINALLSRNLLSIDPDVATRAHVQIRHAPELVVRELDSGREFAVEDLDAFWAERSSSRSNTLEIGLPHRLLERGLMIVDTPGFGGLSPANDAITTAALSKANAVLMVLDAAGPVSKTEIDFLRDAVKRGTSAIAVLTKKDAYQGWKEILAEDQALLERYRDELGSIEILPCSATLKLKADELQREGREELAREFREESGVDQLEQLIAERVVGEADLIRAGNLNRAVQHTIDELASLDRVELAAGDPDRGDGSTAASSRLIELSELETNWTSAVELAHDKLRESLRRECGRAALQMQEAWRPKLEEAASADPNTVVKQLEEDLVANAIKLTTRLQERLAASIRTILTSLGLERDLLDSPATAGPLDAVATASPSRTPEDGLLAAVGGAAGLKQSFGDVFGSTRDLQEDEQQGPIGDALDAIEKTISVKLRGILESALVEAGEEQNERFASYLESRRSELARVKEAQEQARGWSHEEAHQRKQLADERDQEIRRLTAKLEKAEKELTQRVAAIVSAPVTPVVFICYRHEHSEADAGRLALGLRDRFGDDAVFMDDKLRMGNWREKIDRALAQCNVVIAVIGPGWVAEFEARVNRRDELRYEIKTALERGILVVPVTVGRGTLPSPEDAEQLPDDVRGILDYQSYRLGSQMNYERDLEFLCGDLADELKSKAGGRTSNASLSSSTTS